jgi:hypothetical protein
VKIQTPCKKKGAKKGKKSRHGKHGKKHRNGTGGNQPGKH